MTYFWKPIRDTWQDKLIILDSAITGNTYEKAAQYFIGYNRQIRDYEPGDSTYVLSDGNTLLVRHNGRLLLSGVASLDTVRNWRKSVDQREVAERAITKAIKKGKVG